MRHASWTREALNDLDRIHAWLSNIEGADPDRAIGRIRTSVDNLVLLGDHGRPSSVAGLRELSVRHAPYVVAYRVAGAQFLILAVYHTAQDRKP